MWTDSDLDKSIYVAFAHDEDGHELNVGTIEVPGTAYQGPYICTPMPPFGSLKGGEGQMGIGQHVRVPQKQYIIQRNPPAWPHAMDKTNTPIHQYGDGVA